jgi:hypothetical protein
VTPYRYCVKHRLVEGRRWWCPGYYDDKGRFNTIGYWATRACAQREAGEYNRHARQWALL